MKQTVQSKYTLELNQQEFAAMLAAVFSATKSNVIDYYVHGGTCSLNDKDFNTILQNLSDFREYFKRKHNIICSSDLIKGLLKE